MFIHELPKIPMIKSLTHPIHRKEAKNNINIGSAIDPVGVLMFLFMNIGWQKPLEYNPSKFKNKEKGIIAVILTGFIASIIGFIGFAIGHNLVTDAFLKNFMFYGMYYSFVLIMINLLPVPPLDMARLVYTASQSAYFKLIQNERTIHAIFILVTMLNILPFVYSQLFFIAFSKLL